MGRASSATWAHCAHQFSIMPTCNLRSDCIQTTVHAVSHHLCFSLSSWEIQLHLDTGCKWIFGINKAEGVSAGLSDQLFSVSRLLLSGSGCPVGLEPATAKCPGQSQLSSGHPGMVMSSLLGHVCLIVLVFHPSVNLFVCQLVVWLPVFDFGSDMMYNRPSVTEAFLWVPHCAPVPGVASPSQPLFHQHPPFFFFSILFW